MPAKVFCRHSVLFDLYIMKCHILSSSCFLFKPEHLAIVFLPLFFIGQQKVGDKTHTSMAMHEDNNMVRL